MTHETAQVDFNIEDSNPTANRSIAQVLDARLSRRGLLRGALGATGAGTLAATGLSGCASTGGLPAAATQLGFKPVAKGLADAVVVQLNGAANTQSSGLAYGTDLVTQFARAFDAAPQHFPVPAFFDYAATRELMWRERSVRHVLAVQARADLALFGVGALVAPVPSHVYTSGYLEQSDQEALAADGVVGDVCTVFLRGNGSWEDIAINQRATGPNPRQLQAIHRRVCVVSGEAKVAPLLAALRAGAVTDLVIDDSTAAALVRAGGGASGRAVAGSRL